MKEHEGILFDQDANFMAQPPKEKQPDRSPPYPFHKKSLPPGRWASASITPEEFERSVRRFEKHERNCQPYPELRNFYGLPEITEMELQEEKEAEMRAVLDNFWINDKE